MLHLLTGFILFHFDAAWPFWWVFVAIMICQLAAMAK